MKLRGEARELAQLLGRPRPGLLRAGPQHRRDQLLHQPRLPLDTGPVDPEMPRFAVPSDKPVKMNVEFTSGFGVRSDPFHAGAAMHPGIDLAGSYGTPIYATADGTVLRAGWNSGGYGNLVEVDHGRGITTRYGHMSAILVQAGDHVTRGQQIGRMGSTGRSTGNHLHYEVRIDGRAMNPIPFMKSTDYVLAMQRRSGAASMDAVAIGGPTGGQH